MVLKDDDRKPLLRILKELVHCAFLEKELPYYYFTSYLYLKGAPDYRNYIGHKKVHKIKKYAHYTGNKGLYRKTEFEKILSEQEIPTPVILATTHGYSIVTKDKVTELRDRIELEKILSALIKVSASRSVFIKSNEGYGGFHSFKFDSNTITDTCETEKLFNLLQHMDFIVQETIVQHDVIDRIYPHSLNTIRVLAYTDHPKKSIEVLGAYIRFGCGGMIVDNGSSGGIRVPVNVSNWTLQKTGITSFKYGGRHYDVHPDTGFKFEGLVIPFNDKIENIICRTALLFDNRYVGWDVAITNTRPIIIEGNQNPHVIMAQYACNGMKNHPGFRKIFNGYL